MSKDNHRNTIIKANTAPHQGAARLGFGCAHLPGMLREKDAVALLETALDLGITHFDTAPLYGWGAAEPLLGQLAARRRDEMKIVTKVGVAPPGTTARAIGKLSGRAPRPRFGRFSIDQVRESFDQSLRALRTEKVDALLLHEVTPEHLSDELLRALDLLKRDGKVAALGLATSATHSTAILRAYGDRFDIVQVAMDSAPTTTKAILILHSVLAGVAAQRLSRLSRENIHAFEQETGFRLSEPAHRAQVLLRIAMAKNAHGVTLFSSSRKEHVKANAQLAAANPELLAAVERLQASA